MPRERIRDNVKESLEDQAGRAVYQALVTERWSLAVYDSLLGSKCEGSFPTAKLQARLGDHRPNHSLNYHRMDSGSRTNTIRRT